MIEVNYLTRFFNVSLRGGTLLSKFVLLFFLARYLSPSDLGLYGLIIATVAYGIYPLGFDFYTYNTRELIKSDKTIWGGLLKSQGALHLRLYFLFIPLFLGLFWGGLLPWYIAPWFFLLLVLEHLNQEFMRLLIAMSKQLSASVALFLRQGLWALIIVLWMYVDSNARNLDNILLAWSLGSLGALLVSIYTIWALPISGWRLPVDWPWIKKGLNIAIPLFLATLCLSAISTIDKYWFGYLQGNDVLGAYVFFMALAASLISFLEAGVFSFIFPTMIYAANRKDLVLFKRCIKKMYIQITFFSFIFAIFAYIFVSPVLNLIGKEIYIANINLFYILILAMIFHAFSYIPHYALYAQGKDGPIVQSHIFSLLFFVLFVVVLSGFSDFYAIPVALAATYFMILIWKAVSLIKFGILINQN